MDDDYSIHNFAEAIFILLYRFFRLLYLIRLVLPVLIWLAGAGLLIVQWIDTVIDIYRVLIEKDVTQYAYTSLFSMLYNPLFCESCWFLLLLSTSLSLTILLILPINVRELLAASLAVIVGTCSVPDFFSYLDANDNTSHHSYLPLLQQWEFLLVHLHTQAFFNAFLHWSARTHMTLFTIPVADITSHYQSTANIVFLLSLVLFSTRSFLPAGMRIQMVWVYVFGGLLMVSLWALREDTSYWWTLVVGVLWGLYIKYSNSGINSLFMKSTSTPSSSAAVLLTGYHLAYDISPFIHHTPYIFSNLITIPVSCMYQHQRYVCRDAVTPTYPPPSMHPFFHLP